MVRALASHQCLSPMRLTNAAPVQCRPGTIGGLSLLLVHALALRIFPLVLYFSLSLQKPTSPNLIHPRQRANMKTSQDYGLVSKPC